MTDLPPLSTMVLTDQEWVDLGAICMYYLDRTDYLLSSPQIWAKERQLHPAYTEAVERQRDLCRRVLLEAENAEE